MLLRATENAVAGRYLSTPVLGQAILLVVRLSTFRRTNRCLHFENKGTG